MRGLSFFSPSTNKSDGHVNEVQSINKYMKLAKITTYVKKNRKGCSISGKKMYTLNYDRFLPHDNLYYFIMIIISLKINLNYKFENVIRKIRYFYRKNLVIAWLFFVWKTIHANYICLRMKHTSWMCLSRVPMMKNRYIKITNVIFKRRETQ